MHLFGWERLIFLFYFFYLCSYAGHRFPCWIRRAFWEGCCRSWCSARGADGSAGEKNRTGKESSSCQSQAFMTNKVHTHCGNTASRHNPLTPTHPSPYLVRKSAAERRAGELRRHGGRVPLPRQRVAESEGALLLRALPPLQRAEMLLGQKRR